MTGDPDKSDAKSARDARLKSALRDNLKRRKSQARGRAGMTIVTPDDDARTSDNAAVSDAVPDPRDRNG